MAMKKLSIPLLILWILVQIASGSVDIVAVDGIPFVLWCTDYDPAYIAAYPSGFPSLPALLGDDYVQASLCFAAPAYGDRLLVGCCTDWMNLGADSIYVLDPVSLSVLNKRPLLATDFGFYEYNSIGELHLPRYRDEVDSVTVVASIGDCTTDIGVTYIASAGISCPDAGPMPLSDTLHFENCNYTWGPPPVQAPVDLPGMQPLFMSSYCCSNPYTSWGAIRSHLHQEEPSQSRVIGQMCTYGIWYYEAYNCFVEVSVPAFGSCTSEAIGLWTDTTHTLYTSFFTDSVAPSYTVEFPFASPVWDDPAAMTRSQEDPGLLLVWYRDGEIRVRHWESEWNDFDHIVASGQPAVATGNIATCSVSDGYWVAWLPEGASVPIVVFVDRGVVTGIEGFEEPVQAPLALHPSQNPFRESVVFTFAGYPLPEQLMIFDITGRFIRTLGDGSGGSTFLWEGNDTSGSEVPSGTYLVQGTSAGGLASVTVVKL